MQKQCIKCRLFKHETKFCEFTAVTKKGKEKRRRNTCYDCNYNKHVHKSFTWKTATKEQIINQLEKRFNKYVIKKEGCWDWKGFVRPDGYTRMRIGFHTDKKSVGGHVVSWMIHNRKFRLNSFWNDNFNILHTCDNRKCTNPKHLYLGTRSNNMVDMVVRKRTRNVKLTVKQVVEIKKMFKEGVSARNIARKYNVNETTISDIRKKRTWKHVDVDMGLEKRHFNAKLTDDQVREIKQLLLVKERVCVIAKKYEVAHSLISNIKSGKVWKHVII